MLERWRSDLTAAGCGVLLLLGAIYSAALAVRRFDPPDDEDQIITRHDMDLAKHGGAIPPTLLDRPVGMTGGPVSRL